MSGSVLGSTMFPTLEDPGRPANGAGELIDCLRLADPDVRAIREHYGLSQEKFAQLLGISVATLRNWEQKRRKPQGAARVLLCVASKHPEAVLDAIKAA